MKKLFILLTALICCIATASARDVLYLKNGSIIKGELSEVVPTGNVKFKTADGNIFVYATTEVLKITKEGTGSNQLSRDIVNLKNGSVIKGSLTEFIVDNKAVLQTSDGSTFVYAAGDIEKITKDTSVATQQVTTSNNRMTYNTKSEESKRQQELRTSTVNNRHMAKRGYRGFVDFSPGFYVTGEGAAAFEFSTTHGYQLNHNFFIGAGLGVDILTSEYYDASVFVPIFAAFKGNVGSGVAQFTYGTRLGLAVGDYTPFLWNVNVGLRLGFTPSFAMNITPDFGLMADGDYFWARIGLRVGIEF